LGPSAHPWPFRARGNPGARGNFPARFPARHCCPVEESHDAAPPRKDEPHGGCMSRRVGHNVRSKQTRGREALFAWPPKLLKLTAQPVHLGTRVRDALNEGLARAGLKEIHRGDGLPGLGRYPCLFWIKRTRPKKNTSR
jgi:hypothetical protein